MQNRKRDTDVQNRPVCILNHLPCLPLGKWSNGWSSAGVSSWTRQLAPGGSRPVLEWLLVEKCLICSTLSSWQHLLPPASPAGTSKSCCLLPFCILPFHPNPHLFPLNPEEDCPECRRWSHSDLGFESQLLQ